jgi:hypothetical protein
MTLIEVTIVMALAALVVMGMVSFYINSQSMWMAGSSQALAQRDGTLLIETISDRVRAAALAEVQPVAPDPLHQTLILRNQDGLETWRFWWNGGALDDKLVHQGPDAGHDRGPVVASPVTRFQLDTLERLVRIRLVELSAGQGQFIRMSSAAALYNRGTPAP